MWIKRNIQFPFLQTKKLSGYGWNQTSTCTRFSREYELGLRHRNSPRLWCQSLLQPVNASDLIQVIIRMIIAVSDCKRKQTVQNSRYQTKGGGAGGGGYSTPRQHFGWGGWSNSPNISENGDKNWLKLLSGSQLISTPVF